MAGRLTGRPFTLATELRVTKQDGGVLIGDAALAFAGEGATPTHVAVPSGLLHLLRMLPNKYGAEDQDQQAQDIDDFSTCAAVVTHSWTTLSNLIIGMTMPG